MSHKVNPPTSVAISSSKNSILIPHVKQWVQRGFVSGDPSVIADVVHFSRLFYVTKKSGSIRTIPSLSFLNTFISTPGLKMESLSKILPHIVQGMWASSLDVTDAFMSVKISPLFQKYFCFVLNELAYIFLRHLFGLTTALRAFSRLMRAIKRCLRAQGVQVSSFLDDFLMLVVSRALCELHTKWTADHLTWLGFQINKEKLERNPHPWL